MLASIVMRGCKDDANTGETRNMVSGDLDERAIVRDLRKFVEESELSLPKIATLMGVFSATLSIWIAGTAKLSGANLLLIKRFLERRGFSQTGFSSDLT
jgi:DNA-binding transcriptional regulator YiaG